MKKIYVFFLAFIVLINSAAGLIDSNGDISTLSIAAQSISPNPVEPGQDFTVNLRLYNQGKGAAENVRVEFIESPYFKLTGKDDKFDNPFIICSSCSKENQYYFTVSPDTHSGEYPLIFKIWEDKLSFHQETVFVRIISQPDIIFDTNLISNEVTPDSQFFVSLIIKNVGTGIARNLKLVPATPGFVLQNSNLLFIDEIKPGDEIKKNITFLISDSVNEGSQALLFGISYKDEESVSYSIQQSLGIKIVNKVKLDISSITFSPTQIKPGQTVQVGVRVENLGEGQADNIQVRIENNNLEGLNKAFIGKLDEDEDAPAYFSMIAGKPGTSDLKVIVSYEDGLGQHEITEKIPFVISLPASGIGIFFIVAVLLIATIIFFRLRKKKKKSED